jgi:acyl-CoA synthetase (AMP-forming)/AMP-acid ligase II
VLGVFTTGTTAASSKLVLYTRRNIEASQDAIWDLYDAERIEQIFCYPQPYHVFGLLLGHVLAARKQRRLVFAPGAYGRAAHEHWLQTVSARTLTLATPSHMTDLCAYLARRGICPPASYSCLLGGAKVSLDVWRRAQGIARIAEPSVGYGCTEASPGITHLSPGVEPLVDGDVGYPLAGVSLAFAADGESYRIQGEHVAFATIADGRLDFPVTHEVRDALTSLDQGRWAFAGRKDMVLNRGGEKFPLDRIEAVLKARHGVDAICVALPDPRLGEELGILARKGAEASPGEIFLTLAEVFRRAFDPARLTIVDELPLNANAKPDRRAAVELLSRKASAV